MASERAQKEINCGLASRPLGWAGRRRRRPDVRRATIRRRSVTRIARPLSARRLVSASVANTHDGCPCQWSQTRPSNCKIRRPDRRARGDKFALLMRASKRDSRWLPDNFINFIIDIAGMAGGAGGRPAGLESKTRAHRTRPSSNEWPGGSGRAASRRPAADNQLIMIIMTDKLQSKDLLPSP
jgi:hypothetical protein